MVTMNEKYVTTSATGGGDGLTEATAWTIYEASSNATAGDRINIKYGHYPMSGIWFMGAAGASGAPIWWRGYLNEIGDGGKPLISFDSGNRIYSDYPYHTFEDLFITANGGNRAVWFTTNADYMRIINCHIVNETANEVVRSQGECEYYGCYFGAVSQNGLYIDTPDYATFINCTFELFNSGTGSYVVACVRSVFFIGCNFIAPEGHERVIYGNYATMLFKNCNFRGGKIIIFRDNTTTYNTFLQDCIIWGDGSTGSVVLSGDGPDSCSYSLMDNCAIGNIEKRIADDTYAIETNPIYLTESPYEGDSMDLNNKSGGGALCKKGSLPYTKTIE